VVVESDGVHVPLQRKDRKKAKSLEIKVGCVYEGWEAADPKGSRYRLKHPKVLATTGTAEAYWKRVDRHLVSTYDLEKIGLLVFGSDGAPWGQYGTELSRMPCTRLTNFISNVGSNAYSDSTNKRWWTPFKQ